MRIKCYSPDVVPLPSLSRLERDWRPESLHCIPNANNMVNDAGTKKKRLERESPVGFAEHVATLWKATWLRLRSSRWVWGGVLHGLGKLTYLPIFSSLYSWRDYEHMLDILLASCLSASILCTKFLCVLGFLQPYLEFLWFSLQPAALMGFCFNNTVEPTICKPQRLATGISFLLTLHMRGCWSGALSLLQAVGQVRWDPGWSRGAAPPQVWGSGGAQEGRWACPVSESFFSQLVWSPFTPLTKSSQWPSPWQMENQILPQGRTRRKFLNITYENGLLLFFH